MGWHINEQRLIESFLEYVQIDSETKHEGQFGAYMRDALEGLGLEVHTDQAHEAFGGEYGNLIAFLPGDCEGKRVLLSAHLDTVAPGCGIKPKLKDGVITSDGTTVLGADCKAGIAAIIEALRVVKERGLPHPDVQVIFSVGEESGLLGARNIDPSELTSDVGFVLDMSGDVGNVVNEAVRHDRIYFDFHGKAAHAGVCPEQGISAIEAASRAIARMKLGRLDEETVANIGTIQGGVATNIVPEHVHVAGEARSHDDAKCIAQIEHMKRCAEEAAAEVGATVEVRLEFEYDHYLVPEDSTAMSLARAACEATGVECKAQRGGGGSDANIYNAIGVPSVVLACGMEAMHTKEEQLATRELVRAAELVVNLVIAACKA